MISNPKSALIFDQICHFSQDSYLWRDEYPPHVMRSGSVVGPRGVINCGFVGAVQNPVFAANLADIELASSLLAVGW